MDSMFDKLMGLSLFKGVSRERMAKTVGECKFHFLKYAPGTVIFKAGEQCRDITFVLSGSVRIDISMPEGRFALRQSIGAGQAVSPEFLFGRITTYPGDVTAIDQVSVLRVAKCEYMRILASDPIFLYNYANLMSMNAQKAVEGVKAISNGDIERRIALWINALTQPRSFDIELSCEQGDMATLFGVQPEAIRSALEAMNAAGLVDFTPQTIRVKDRKGLMSLLHDNDPELAE